MSEYAIKVHISEAMARAARFDIEAEEVARAEKELLAKAGPGPVEKLRRHWEKGEQYRKGEKVGGYVALTDSPPFIEWTLIAERGKP